MKNEKRSRKGIIFIGCLWYALFSQTIQGQNYLGVRFASELNYFPRYREYGLVSSPFTTGILGVSNRIDKRRSSFEFGVNLVYKNGDDKGLPNLPGVMQDFDKDQSVGLASAELMLLAGPRLDWLYPRIGYILGYRWEIQNLQIRPRLEENRIYLHLPFGAAAHWPANFGSVGLGLYYVIGVTNVLRNPNPGNNTIIYNGGRMHSIHLELSMAFGK